VSSRRSWAIGGRDVATQSLEPLAIAAGHGRARMDVDATHFGERVVGLGDLSHRVRELASLLPWCITQQLPVRGRGPVARRKDGLLSSEQSTCPAKDVAGLFTH
jgi:hypothetical protein